MKIHRELEIDYGNVMAVLYKVVNEVAKGEMIVASSNRDFRNQRVLNYMPLSGILTFLKHEVCFKNGSRLYILSDVGMR